MPGREMLEVTMPKGTWFERCKAKQPATSEASQTRSRLILGLPGFSSKGHKWNMSESPLGNKVASFFSSSASSE